MQNPSPEAEYNMDTITTPPAAAFQDTSGSACPDGISSVPDCLKGPNDQVLPRWSVPEESVLPVAVIIPTHNNELTIGTLVILSKKYAATVIVADNCSTDRTMEVAESAGAVVIDALAYGSGRVQSILAGCKVALGYGYKAVVLVNSSGEHLTREIPRIARPVLDGESDLVIGSRYLSGRRGIPPYPLNTSAASSPLRPDRAPVSFTDPESGFRAISVKGICLLDLLPDTPSFEPMMISLFARKGLVIQEIPVKLRNELSTVGEVVLTKYRGKKIAVVVPAHNEQLLLGETLSTIPGFVTRVYVVNDCSTDRTQEVLDYYAGNDESIIPIRHNVNQGVGKAIVTGYKRALDDGMEVMAVMAGDNQMDPAFLPALLDPIIDGKCDYTMGNRLINPEYRKGMSKWRLAGNTVLTLLTKIASGYWSMMDPQNGYTAISRRALDRINLDEVYPRYGYCNDLLVKLNANSFRVINVPHPARYGRETSGIKYRTYILTVSHLLLTDFLWRMKTKYVVLSFNPLVLFYMGGVAFLGTGVLCGLYSLHYKFVQNQPIFVPLTLTLILFGIGFMLLFFAMFFDMSQERSSNGWYA
jgi:glycosyltransferase involved in cell wall biosynthesis